MTYAGCWSSEVSPAHTEYTGPMTSGTLGDDHCADYPCLGCFRDTLSYSDADKEELRRQTAKRRDWQDTAECREVRLTRQKHECLTARITWRQARLRDDS